MSATKLSLILLALVCSLADGIPLTRDAADHAATVVISTDFYTHDGSPVDVNKAIVDKRADYEQFSQTTKNNENGAKTRRATSNDDEKSESDGKAKCIVTNKFASIYAATAVIFVIICVMCLIDSGSQGFVVGGMAAPWIFCIARFHYQGTSFLTMPNLLLTIIAAEATVIFLKVSAVLTRFLGRPTCWTDTINFIRWSWEKLTLWIKSRF